MADDPARFKPYPSSHEWQSVPLSPVEPALSHIWAKWSRDPSQAVYHPLLCHMLDVAEVAQRVWNRALGRAQRIHIADALGLAEPDARMWAAFWAGLHDIGKASPAFQTQLPPDRGGDLVAGWMRADGLPTRGASWAPHGAISVLLLEELLVGVFGLNEELTVKVARAIGAHHGLFVTSTQLNEVMLPERVGSGSWLPLQRRLVECLAGMHHLPPAVPTGVLSDGDAMALTGLISVADWIGSDATRFRLATPAVPAPAPLDLSRYRITASQRADDAMANMSWEHDRDLEPRTFAQLFPGKQPRPVQQAIIELARTLTAPGLVIIEVPMGEGKTEGAMYLADHWAVHLGSHGAYFALPTMATSNQMFERVRAFLESRFGDSRYVNLHLAHGMAVLSEEYARLRDVEQLAASTIYDADDPRAAHLEPQHGGVVAAEWFAAPKRTLISPFGVGTVDQALLAGLQVKHHFVRLFGLGSKTVIIDEVHAYDTYMSTLLERLLEWLAAMGTPVVLLSATLPAASSHKLRAAYARGAKWSVGSGASVPYPRISYLSSSGSDTIAITATAKSRTLHLRFISGRLPMSAAEAFGLAEQIVTALADGGCAAVVCNTVRRAQDVYCALEVAFSHLPDADRPSLTLFHARMLHGDRLAREADVLGSFGRGDSPGQRNPARPHRAVLVATQVIEQSLDLDFDLMISDLAPADLLLQRAGRMHRHEENDPHRPRTLAEPMLWVCAPDEDEHGVPTFEESDEFIYSGHILLRTWSALRGRDVIAIPDDMERLIEAVYNPHAPEPTGVTDAYIDHWRTTLVADRKEADNAMAKAKQIRVLPPGNGDAFRLASHNLIEDTPQAHESIQAQTRLGDLTIPAVLLDPDQAAGFNAAHTPSLDEVRVLLNRSVNLSHKRLVAALLTTAVPPGWMRSPWLRTHRLLVLDAHGQATVTDSTRSYLVTLDPTLGVLVTTHRKED